MQKRAAAWNEATSVIPNDFSQVLIMYWKGSLENLVLKSCSLSVFWFKCFSLQEVVLAKYVLK